MSAGASLVTLVVGMITGPAAAAALGVELYSPRAAAGLEWSLFAGALFSGIILIPVDAALRVKVWPGIVAVTLLLSAIASLAFPANIWQSVHLLSVSVLPLALGAAMLPVLARIWCATERPPA